MTQLKSMFDGETFNFRSEIWNDNRTEKVNWAIKTKFMIIELWDNCLRI